MSDAIAYFRARAERELEFANRRGDRSVARAHRELAKLYGRRALEAEARAREAGMASGRA